MSVEMVATAGGQPKTLLGVLYDSLGFLLFLTLVEGGAWVLWCLTEVQDHYYFSTTPFNTFGGMIPW